MRQPVKGKPHIRPVGPVKGMTRFVLIGARWEETPKAVEWANQVLVPWHRWWRQHQETA